MKHRWILTEDEKLGRDMLVCLDCDQKVPVGENEFLRGLDSLDCPQFNKQVDRYIFVEIKLRPGVWAPHTYGDNMRDVINSVRYYDDYEFRFTNNDLEETFYGW